MVKGGCGEGGKVWSRCMWRNCGDGKVSVLIGLLWVLGRFLWRGELMDAVVVMKESLE